VGGFFCLSMFTAAFVDQYLEHAKEMSGKALLADEQQLWCVMHWSRIVLSSELFLT
jgi:hypothetical protein